MKHLTFILIMSAIVAGATPASATAPRPNIVLIMADDMGYSDIGCYGGEIDTPNIDRLAAEGIRFTQFYNMPRCTPTRAALLTGLYSHQAGLGEVPEYGHLVGGPGYLSHLNDQCVTVAEVLREAGYATYMSGNWHLGRERPHWPVDRGFEKSEALIDCCSNFFGDPEANEERTAVSMRERYAIDDKLWRPPPDGFYSTDWFGANAARMIREHPSGEPFFLYLSFTAPHWPLQARPADIAKYKGKFREGWAAIRQRRFERMRAMGLLDPNWNLSTPEGPVPDWSKLSDTQRDGFDTRMAIYAAMIDAMDRNIGGVLDALKQRGFDENTVVLFLSDNGATHENPNRGRPGAALGSRDSYHGYGIGWAAVSNTPFRLYKHWVHEGGISTPFIARWPKGIARASTYYRHPAHIIDFMATAVALARSVSADVWWQNHHPNAGCESRARVQRFAGSRPYQSPVLGASGKRRGARRPVEARPSGGRRRWLGTLQHGLRSHRDAQPRRAASRSCGRDGEIIPRLGCALTGEMAMAAETLSIEVTVARSRRGEHSRRKARTVGIAPLKATVRPKEKIAAFPHFKKVGQLANFPAGRHRRGIECSVGG